MTILILGGTGEARELAGRLVDAGLPVVTSLAGGVGVPTPPPGEVRVGGFGGTAGLASYLSEQRTSLVVDATHPFAALMTAHAVSACRQLGVPLLRLSRPGWRRRAGASQWHWVASLAAAKRAAQGLGRRVFLSIGRQGLAEFADWTDRYVLARVVEAPDVQLPPSWELLQSRGPFDAESERELLRDRRIDVLVTKDSGGEQTAAKLDAATELGVAVVIVARPPDPSGVERVDSVDAAFAWVEDRLSAGA